MASVLWCWQGQRLRVVILEGALIVRTTFVGFDLAAQFTALFLGLLDGGA